MIKQRRFSKKDWKEAADFVKAEHEKRETSQFRRFHESRWKEVDRQLAMEPLQRVGTDGQDLGRGWQSEIELGELSKVSEVVIADAMRITFPAERDWFEPHVEIPGAEGPQEPIQSTIDNGYKNLFVQQHLDFGFDERFELSAKEGLHHGSFVVEVDWYDDMMVMDGSRVRKIGGPVWVPHSMWNCYPDESPRCVAQNMFYQGSMIIKKYWPRYKLEMQKGEGWMPAQYSEVPDDEHAVGRDGSKRRTKDLEIITYWGDIVIPRKSGDDIYLPNSKCILANGVCVYWNTNPYPWAPIIYRGYEKQDPRDPYYTSPLIKLSSWGKMGSILANEYIDNVRLASQPPVVYDAGDPNFAANGFQRSPGAAMPTQGSADFKEVTVGDPSAPLAGLELAIRIIQEGTGVNSVRTGAPESDRKTAYEVNKVAQGAEVRTVDYIRKLNSALRTWLYMQHEMNRRNLKEYTFYSDDMNTQDFVRITDTEYNEFDTIHFDVVGAKGILGEEQRMMRQTQVTAFASTNPLFAGLLKPKDLLIAMYKDAGIKAPERFVNTEDQEDPRLQQMQQAIQQLQGELMQAQQQLQEKMTKIMVDAQQKTADREVDYKKHLEDINKEWQMQTRDLVAELQNVVKDYELREKEKERNDNGAATGSSNKES